MQRTPIAGDRKTTPQTPPPGGFGDRDGPARGRPALLLARLAEHPEQVVSVPRLVAQLWPGIDLATGRARLHVVASRLRRQLPPGAVLEAEGDGYRLVGFAPPDGVASSSDPSPGPPAHPSDARPSVLRAGVLDALPAAGTIPLVAVSAPAGFGKTVLLRQWAARQAGPVTWVDLAEASDPAAALDQALGIALGLGGDAPATPQPGAVVVDGLERVGDADLGPAIEAVVRRRAPVTLALASREALSIPTGRLVIRGQAVVLGPDDLALTAEEAGALGPGAGADLVAQTAGWPEVVARLAAVADPGASDVVAAGRALLGRILDGLPPDLAALLIATGPLDRIQPGLADAVLAQTGTGPLLAALADRHHLLVRDGDSYVHRPLLAGLLRAGPPRAEIRLHHLRAARWHMVHGDPEQALHHAALAPDLPTVRVAFAPAVQAAAGRGDAATLLEWIASVRPPSHPDAASVALVVWALAPHPDRDRWRPGREAPAPVGAAVRALDRLGDGRGDAARAAAAEARARLGEVGSDARPVLDAVLHLVEVEAMVLQGHHVPPRRGVLGPGPWPWFVLWGFGIRALEAELAGRRQQAAALIDHGRARAGSPHPSWTALAPAPWALAQTLVDLDRSGASADRSRAVADLGALADRLDPVNGPLAVVARLGLNLARHRAGDEAGAARALAEADAGARSLPASPFLVGARAALVQRAGRTPRGELSVQERRVLGYLSTDMALGEIADALFLSPHTVKAHTRSIYRKLQVHTRAEAIDAILRA